MNLNRSVSIVRNHIENVRDIFTQTLDDQILRLPHSIQHTTAIIPLHQRYQDNKLHPLVLLRLHHFHQ